VAAFLAALTLNGALLGALALREVRTAGPAAEPPQTVIHARIEPWPASRRSRLAAAADGRSGADRPETARTAESHDHDEDNDDSTSAAPAAPRPISSSGADAISDTWRVRPATEGDRVAQALRAGGLNCTPANRLTAEERDRCDQRFVTAGARRITGTGDAERDARFARQGARELAAYEARRAAPPARTPCDKGGPIADCGAEISVEIFSSIDGFFPNLRRED